MLPRIDVVSLTLLTPAEVESAYAAFSKRGCVLFNLSGNGAADDDPAKELAALGRQFGRPINIQKLSNMDGVHPIRHIPGYPEYANTTTADLQLHTDGSFEPLPPKVMLIYCETPAEVGGLTRLCFAEDIYAHLAGTKPQTLEGLFRADAFTIRRDDRQSVKPVFQWKDGRVRMTYRTGGDIFLKIHPAAQAGFAEIERYLSNPANYTEFRLEHNQALVIDNTRVLHGRTHFLPASSRSLHGLWCNGEVGGARLLFGFAPE